MEGRVAKKDSSLLYVVSVLFGGEYTHWSEQGIWSRSTGFFEFPHVSVKTS